MTRIVRANGYARLVLGVLTAAFFLLLFACGGGGGLTPEQQAAEDNRRATLTPEQRVAEDKAKAEAEAEKNRDAQLQERIADVQVQSQDYVRKFLNHPDDASFGFFDVPSVRYSPEGDTFWVSSKVKAKNDFGAELTYRWETILMLNNHTWELASCTIDGEVVYTSSVLLDKILAREQNRGGAGPTIDDKQAEADRKAAAERRAAAEKAEKERKQAEEAAKWRTWTDSSGEHKTEAKFGGVIAGKVKLIKRDGSTLQIPLEKLSDEDQDWINNRRR